MIWHSWQSGLLLGTSTSGCCLEALKDVGEVLLYASVSGHINEERDTYAQRKPMRFAVSSNLQTFLLQRCSLRPKIPGIVEQMRWQRAAVSKNMLRVSCSTP